MLEEFCEDSATETEDSATEKKRMLALSTEKVCRSCSINKKTPFYA